MPKLSDIPPCPSDAVPRGSHAKPSVYKIQVVTPMFGGGAVAGRPDETLPIRGASIRGQLQFWWRATRGALLATPEELFERHAKIWGKTEEASPVRVEVRDVQCGEVRNCAHYDWNERARGGKGGWRLEWEPPFRRTPLPYALFPFQGKQPKENRRGAAPVEEPASFIESASFFLHLHFPETLREDVEMSLRAWTAFGGLGARTRRGCGSLRCDELSPASLGELAKWLTSSAFPKSAGVHDWPTLPAAILVQSIRESPVAAWHEVIEHYQQFRQGVGVARNEKPNRQAGRSRFPEPDAIRKTTGCWLPRHEPSSEFPDDAFPRAEFGLPIVFHFKDSPRVESHNVERHLDPPKTELYPFSLNGEKRDRMASPLILKPLAFADGRAVAMALRLRTPALNGVELWQDKTKVNLPPTTVISHPKLASYDNSPLAASPSGSALEAFMALLRQEQNFHEVPL